LRNFGIEGSWSKVLVQQNSKWQNERKNLDTELAKLAKARKAQEMV
jgi:hypothetical protein